MILTRCTLGENPFCGLKPQVKVTRASYMSKFVRACLGSLSQVLLDGAPLKALNCFGVHTCMPGLKLQVSFPFSKCFVAVYWDFVVLILYRLFKNAFFSKSLNVARAKGQTKFLSLGVFGWIEILWAPFSIQILGNDPFSWSIDHYWWCYDVISTTGHWLWMANLTIKEHWKITQLWRLIGQFWKCLS